MAEIIDAAFVTSVYRVLLGREPESDAIVRTWVNNAASRQDLLRSFVTSAEFAGANAGLLNELQTKTAPPKTPSIASSPPLSIDWDVPPPLTARMLRRIEAVWQKLGETEPHWSVLSADRFRQANLGESRAQFDQSGAGETDMIAGVLRRQGIDLAQFAHAVEYGAGVGRMTRHLAPRVKRLTALDISASHLALAEAWLEANGVGNATCLRVADAETFGMTEPFDFWFSRIVLQHNPPPVMAQILRRAFAMLKPGGMALFQLPTYAKGYAFHAEDYLAEAPGGAAIEMHCLPQSAVFALAAAAGCVALEVREDNATGHPSVFISNLFLFRKAA
ncbi:MAG: methyltransferase domain-containing protein [Alphaproteobacteria bacterium]|nr:methyltransferase domain-containing protein [Alphaproteobacteria bacterium]